MNFDFHPIKNIKYVNGDMFHKVISYLHGGSNRINIDKLSHFSFGGFALSNYITFNVKTLPVR